MNLKIAMVAFTIIIAFGIYFLFSPYLKEEHGHESEGHESIESLIDELEKSAEFYSQDGSFMHSDYILTDNKENKGILLIKKEGSNFEISLQKSLDSWRIISLNGKKAICYSFDNAEACSEDLKLGLEDAYSSLEGALLTKEWVAKTFIKKYQVMEKAGAISSFSKQEKEVNGEKCAVFETTYSYKKLNAEELQELNIAINSAWVENVKEFKETICIGKDGRIVERILEYQSPSKNIEKFELLKYEKNVELHYPEEMKGYSGISQLIDIMLLYSKKLDACNAANDTDKKEMCFREMAIEFKKPEVCKNAENREICLDAYIAITKDSENACPLFEEYKLEVPEICSKN